MEANLTAQAEPTTSILIEDFLASCAGRNLSPQTIKLYRHSLNRLMEFCPVPACDVDTRLLRRFIDDLQSDGLSASTVHDYFGIVKVFFKYLALEKFIESDPAASIPMPKKTKRVPKVLSGEQAQALLDACPDYTWTGQRDKVAIFVLLGSGIRLSEMLGLDLGDVDLESGELNIMGKGSKERIVSIDDETIMVLRGWLETRSRILRGQPNTALFINRYSGRMGKTFAATVKRYAKEAGFFCTPHVLRHTYATDWVRNGGDLQRLKEQLGHSHISMTEKYIHMARKDFKEAVNQYSITKHLKFDSRQMQLCDRVS